jgi:hypothetical protein
MDTLSHALWGKGLFGYRKYSNFSLFFGAIPDLLSFGLYFLINLFFNSSSLRLGKPKIEDLPDWLFVAYDFSHSIVIAFIFIMVTYLYNKDFCFPMLAWPFHIVLDFFTHSIDYFATPIFWPISNYKFNGISWSSPAIMITNFIFIFMIFIYRKKKSFSTAYN